MNDPKRSFHAISYLDAFGEPPYLSRLPREEEDFADLEQARNFLLERGGGTIEQCTGDSWKLVASVLPPCEGGNAYLVA